MNLKLSVHLLFSVILGICAGIFFGYLVSSIIAFIFGWTHSGPSWSLWVYGIIMFISLVICTLFFLEWDKRRFEPKE